MSNTNRVAIEFASRLNGATYPFTLGKDASKEAKTAGIVVVYGSSDDLMEFEGAIYDELGVYDGDTAYVDAKGLLDRSRIDDGDDEAIAEFVARKKSARTIEALWDYEGYSWTYKTEIPHATFEILEDGDSYCRGIVFHLDDLRQPEAPA